MTYDLKMAGEMFGKHFTTVDEIYEYVNDHMNDEKVKQFLDYHERLWRKEEVAEDGRRMYNEIWKDVTDKYIDRVKECLEGTEDNNFSCGYVADVIQDECGNNIPNENQGKHQVIYLHGGKNGCGKWIDYMKDMLSIIQNLYMKFDEVYLCKWDVDVADDVFYAWIGVN